MPRNPVIAHISDLHLGRQTNPLKFWRRTDAENAKNALRRALQEIEPRPDFLVVTGDLSNGGRPSEMRDARTYLQELLQILRDRGQFTRCITIPGNHDVWRTTRAHPGGYLFRRDRLTTWRNVFGDGSFLWPEPSDGALGDLVPRSLLPYYSGRVDSANAEKRAAEAMRVCEFFPEFQLAFLKLDSNIKDSRAPGHIARGKVGLLQRDLVSEVLGDYHDATKDDNVRFADARLVCLVHHHLTRLPNTKLENWMLMDDAGEVSKWLALHRTYLVLHGHYHRADAAGLTFWNLDEPNEKTEMVILSGGAATALDVDDGHNSCHYIHLGHYYTNVWRPRLDNGEYEPLNVAAKFQFIHSPRLRIAHKLPLYVEALEASVQREEKYADYDHVYESAESTGYIDEHRGYAGRVDLRGRNTTDRPTTYIPFVLTAVGAQDATQFEFNVEDLNTKQILGFTLQEDRPIDVFPFRLFFDPLKAKGDFAIRVRFRLPMVMLWDYDYDWFNLVRYPRGLSRLTIRLLSERRIVGASLYELRRTGLEKSRIALTAATETQPVGPPRLGYEAVIESPSALSYVLIYEKLEKQA